MGVPKAFLGRFWAFLGQVSQKLVFIKRLRESQKMLFEGIKINMLSPEEREAAKEASKQMRKEYRKANRRDKAYRYGLFAGHQLGARVVSPRIINALQTRHLIKSTLKRERKLDKKERQSRMYEDSARKAGPLRRAGTWADNKARAVQKFALDHPGQAAVGGVLASIGSQALMGIGSHYMQHRAKMKIDPNYAAQTYHFARQKATRTGEFAPILPSQAANKPQKNMQPDNQTPAEEGRGNVPTNKKNPHKKENAHMAIMRQGTMDMDKINSVGLAGSKNYKVPTRTQTGTQKEDCMGVDAAISMVDRLDEMSMSNISNTAQTAWKNFKPQASTAWKGLKKEVGNTYNRVKPHAQDAFKHAKKYVNSIGMEGRGGKTYRNSAKEGFKGAIKKGSKAFKGNSVSEHVSRYAGEIYEVVPWGTIGTELAKGAASTLGGTAVNRTFQKMDDRKAAKMAKKQRHFENQNIADTIVERATQLYEVLPVVAAAGTALATGAAAAVGGHLANKAIQKISQKKAKTEEIGYGGKTEYELNPAKNYQAAAALKRNQDYDATISSRRTYPRNMNKPRYSVNPQMTYGESVLEAAVGNAVNNIGSTLDHYAGKAVKGAVSGAKKAAGGYVDWLGTGSHSTQAKKLIGSVAAAHLARKAWKARKGNKAYQEKRAAYHRERYNDAAQNLDYAQARDDLRSRRRNW